MLIGAGLLAKKAVEKGLMPAQLRDVLLSGKDTRVRPLVTNQARAEEGRINEAENDNFINDTIARDRLPPEVSKESVTPDFWKDLPEEIRAGLWQFNESKTNIRILSFTIE